MRSAEKIANAILDGACGGNVGVGHGSRGAIVCNRCVAVAIRAAQVEAAEEMRERCATEVGTRPADTKRADRFRREATDAIRALPVEEPR